MHANAAYQRARMARDRRFDGTFFVAVHTTGIFCRPICPAVLPKEENVAYFEKAEAALAAGYRPCLRCRPDSAPHSYAWRGVDTTLDRAVRLLSSWPDENFTALAQRLGVSDRYVRKLFQTRIGISPKRYQLYSQLLFAKQLLHDSELSVEEVAQASGFASSRRLQDHFQRHFALTPGQIRKQQVPQSDAKADTQGLSISLSYQPPYDWAHLRDFLRLRAVPCVEHVDEDSYARSFSYRETKGYFHATYLPERSQFRVQLELSQLNDLRAIVAQIRRILDLDAPTSLISQRLLAAGMPSADIRVGLRVPGVWDGFEAGCRAILGQQVSVKAAVGEVSRLVDTLGEQCSQGRRFPSAQAVAEAPLEFLRIPGARKDTLRRFAQCWATRGEKDTLDDIAALKGIGPWTVQYLEMRGLSNPDIWLATDLVIKKQLALREIDPKAVEPWRSYLTLQLWSMA